MSGDKKVFIDTNILIYAYSSSVHLQNNNNGKVNSPSPISLSIETVLIEN
ncbi:MAG: hypothetical protein UV38_C0003G0225 [candidate division TM6 bacterium GW2011_GWE2_42_60]|nr:MAG: hypothetical protein UV38_C0003G0225 [candidate division TM6 bacterium GW2011_GWE2_42_60]